MTPSPRSVSLCSSSVQSLDVFFFLSLFHCLFSHPFFFLFCRLCSAAADRKLRLLTSDLQERHEVKVAPHLQHIDLNAARQLAVQALTAEHWHLVLSDVGNVACSPYRWAAANVSENARFMDCVYRCSRGHFHVSSFFFFLLCLGNGGPHQLHQPPGVWANRGETNCFSQRRSHMQVQTFLYIFVIVLNDCREPLKWKNDITVAKRCRKNGRTSLLKIS